jgi:hypothetical protein
MTAEGKHERRRHLEEDMGSPKRNDEVKDRLIGFATINSGHAMKVVTKLGYWVDQM